jgi:hypothetical protein
LEGHFITPVIRWREYILECPSWQGIPLPHLGDIVVFLVRPEELDDCSGHLPIDSDCFVRAIRDVRMYYSAFS